MASSTRGGAGSQEAEPPTQFASTTPPQTPMMDHSFTLQAIMDLKGTVATLVTKTDRLIDDVSKQGNKIDTVQHQISFVKGAMWIIGALVTVVTIALGGAALYFKIKG